VAESDWEPNKRGGFMRKIFLLTALLSALQLTPPAIDLLSSISRAQEEPEPKPGPKPKPRPEPEFQRA
jgi:hypothetical protein